MKDEIIIIDRIESQIRFTYVNLTNLFILPLQKESIWLCKPIFPYFQNPNLHSDRPCDAFVRVVWVEQVHNRIYPIPGKFPVTNPCNKQRAIDKGGNPCNEIA